MAIDDVLRSILDGAYSIAPAILGLHKYTANLIVITNTGGSRPGVGGVRQVITTPLFVGDGYAPQIINVSSKDIILSNDRLKDTDKVIGPLVFPFITPNAFDGYGIDIAEFDPISNIPISNQNMQIYFQVFGPGLNINGDYFEKIYTEISGSGALSYKVYIRNIGAILP